jgi:hypothetical protein
MTDNLANGCWCDMYVQTVTTRIPDEAADMSFILLEAMRTKTCSFLACILVTVLRDNRTHKCNLMEEVRGVVYYLLKSIHFRIPHYTPWSTHKVDLNTRHQSSTVVSLLDDHDIPAPS